MDALSTARRHALLAGLAWVGGAAVTTASAAALPPAQALPEELGRALAAGKPLLVMVSLEGCPFCRVVRDHYLAPMREREGLAVVQVDMRSNAPLRDLKGTFTTHDDLIRAWGVKVAPTVLFFGRAGVEIAERLVGGYIPDFYGAYLDERLRMAHKAVRG